MGVVASINNGPLSAMMDHSSIWCPPVHRQANSAVFGFTAEREREEWSGENTLHFAQIHHLPALFALAT